MEFLFHDGSNRALMDPNTFEQAEIPSEMLGPGINFLKIRSDSSIAGF